tara:strand:- start:4066 stop:4191 length:126 start_codon:yes stop_codon:yes gene_type:complete
MKEEIIAKYESYIREIECVQTKEDEVLLEAYIEILNDLRLI